MAMMTDTNAPVTVSLSGSDLFNRAAEFLSALAAGQAAARDFERSRVATDGVLSSEEAVRTIFARHFG